MRKRNLSEAVGFDTDMSSRERQFVSSLARGLDVLRAFRPDDHAGLSNGDLARRTGIPASSMSRLTYTLLETGYMVHDRSSGRYRLGVPVLSLGYACLSGQPIHTTAQGHMQQLAGACGEGVQVSLGERVGHTMIYLASARARSVVSLQLDVGSRISMARTAMGRAYVAGCSPGERSAILEDIHAHFPPAEAARREESMRRAMEEIAVQGFCTSFGDWLPGVNAVGVPFRSIRGATPNMAFSLAGPATHVAPDQLQEDFGPRLVALAEVMQRAVP